MRSGLLELDNTTSSLGRVHTDVQDVELLSTSRLPNSTLAVVGLPSTKVSPVP